MLILTRRAGEAIILRLEDGRRIEIRVLGVKGNQVRHGIECDKSIKVDREEVCERKEAEAQGKPDVNGNR